MGWAWAGREGGGLIRVTEMILTQALSNVNFGYKCFDFHLLFQILLSGLVNPVEDITLQATNHRRTVKRLSRSVDVDELGHAKVGWRITRYSETNAITRLSRSRLLEIVATFQLFMDFAMEHRLYKTKA